MTQWDFQNKGKSDWTGTSSFVLEVLLCNLRTSIIYSVPCDRIVQRAFLQPVFTSENISEDFKVKETKPYLIGQQ